MQCRTKNIGKQKDFFKFIDVNGKTGCILSKKEGSEFNGRIIKQVARTDNRLLKQPIFSDSSEDDDQSLPPLKTMSFLLKIWCAGDLFAE